MKNLLPILTIFLCFISSNSIAAYNVGVFYFPSWYLNCPGENCGWNKIKKFNEITLEDSYTLKDERIPEDAYMYKAGDGNYYYNPNDQTTMDNELQTMSESGINFVIFDWYGGNPQLHDGAVNAYLNTTNKHNIKFSIMWENFSSGGYDTYPEMLSLLRKWEGLVKNPNYYRENGKAVIYIFSTQSLIDKTNILKTNPDDFLNWAKKVIKNETNVDVSFYLGGALGYNKNADIFNGANGTKGTKNWVSAAGYFNYNHHAPATISLKSSYPENDSPCNQSHSYAELNKSYVDQWNWAATIIKNQKYAVPVSVGWDKRPWGDSTCPSKGIPDPKHDLSRGTPDEFKAHLSAAKNFIDTHKSISNNQVLVCCWNEFGEGSILIPTIKNSDSFIRQIKYVFPQ